jgi:transcription termination factor NusB
VQAELGQLPATEVTAQGRARDEAQKHVAQAVEEMKESEDKLSDARYEATASQDKAGLSEPADSARRQLAEAGRAIRQGLAGDKQKTAAEQAREMAEQLTEDADTLDESLSPADRQRMLERLEATKRLLQSNPDPQWSSMSRGGAANGTLVYTQGGSMTPAEIARMLAREFWSIAIEARQKELQPFVEPPSDAEFFQVEKEFFEKAARFKPSKEK